MRIWFQSTLPIDKDPMFREYKSTLQAHLNKIAREGTEIVIHGTDVASPFLELYVYEELLHDRYIVDRAIQAEREGYDAFCVGCMNDPAFYALREATSVPVCSIAETSMLLACLLSPNFSLLASTKEQLRRQTELVKCYGLQDRFIECEPMKISLDKIQQGFENPEVVTTSAKEVATETARKRV